MISESLRPYDLSVPNARNPVVAATVLSSLATITTLVRYASRIQRKVGLGWDDLLLLVALLSGYSELILYWCCVILGGTGRHAIDVGYPDILLTLKLLVPFEFLYNLSMTSLKCSIILFYFRLFSADRRIIIYGRIIIGSIIVWAIASIIVICLICRPFSHSWNPSQPGTCGNRNTMYIVNGVGNIFIDIACLILPLPTIRKLKLPTAQKIGLLFCFSLGIFVTIISIIRIKALTAINFEDITWSLPGGMEWTCLEESIGTVNANLPFLRPVFKYLTPKAFAHQWASRSKSHGATAGITVQTGGDQTDGTFSVADKSSRYIELSDIERAPESE